MLQHRVIPCFLLRNNGLVKTIKFKDPTYIGDPVNAIRIFNDKEVDELIVLDIDASKAGRGPNFDLIEQFAGECFMPLCYGGGVSSIEQARRLFSLGIEKVCLQTSALDNAQLIRQIADEYGSQAVVVSVDVKKNLFGRYQLFSANTGKAHKYQWQEFLAIAVESGAGEIMLTAVDRDGTLSGMDEGLIHVAAESCSVPIIAAGGASSLDDLRSAVKAGASAVAAGAMFVFHGPHRAVLITYPKYEDLISCLDV